MTNDRLSKAFDEFDVDSVDFSTAESADMESHETDRRAPRIHVAEHPADDRRVKILHADATSLTLEQEEDADTDTFVNGWVSVTLFFGDGGLYVGFDANRAEEFGRAMIRAAENLRKVEAENGRKSESVD